MNNELTELKADMEDYALVHLANEIPLAYYETMINTWREMNRQGYNWCHSDAADSLLYTSVNDKIIHISQLSPAGYEAIKRAATFIKSLSTIAA